MIAEPNRLYTRAETAAMLRLKEQTLASWVCNGTAGLPYLKISRRVLYRGSDINAFLAASMRGVGVANAG